MRGSSAASWDRLLADLPTGEESLGEGLLAAARALRTQPTLRRSASDPSIPLDARSRFLEAVFGPHLPEAATKVVGQAGGLRWTSGRDLDEALERLGVTALVRSAEESGEGDRIEDELFAFSQAVTEHPELREALTEPTRSVEDKQALIADLLGDKAAATSVRLAQETVTDPHRSILTSVDDMIDMVADARSRQVATVRTAHPLTEEQASRLSAGLARQAGKDVHLNVVVDPAVLGGLRVEMGDFVIDGSVASRLDEVRRQMAG